MSGENTNPKSVRNTKTLDEEIAVQREKLRKLEERHRDQKRKERERNQKAVMELIKTERLDLIPSNIWREAMPKIKSILVVDVSKQEENVKPINTA